MQLANTAEQNVDGSLKVVSFGISNARYNSTIPEGKPLLEWVFWKWVGNAKLKYLKTNLHSYDRNTVEVQRKYITRSLTLKKCQKIISKLTFAILKHSLCIDCSPVLSQVKFGILLL